MPNFGLVINSTYNPMSFEQYAAPFEKYAEVYNKMADTYDALEMEANQWEKLANSTQDAKQYEQYKQYASDLRAAANDLAENGLSTKTRGAVSNLKRRYAAEIKPIEDAYTLREKERELQRQAIMQNPDIIFSRDASTTGLDAYMNGTPALSSYDGRRLYEYTSKALEQIAKTAREDLMANGVNSEWYKILGGQYYQKDDYTGVTPDVVMQSMFDAEGNLKPEANKYLASVAEGAIDLSGMRNWSNWNDVASRAYNYVNQGLWGAIGSEQEKQLSNKYYDYALKQEAARMNQTDIAINPSNIYSQAESNGYEKMFEDGVTRDSQNKLVLTEKGKSVVDEYIDFAKKPKYYTEDGEQHVDVTKVAVENTPLGNFVSELVQNNPNITKEKIYNEVQNYLDSKGVLRKGLPHDATRVTEYYYNYKDSYRKNITDEVLRALNGEALQEVDYDSKEQSFKPTGNKITGEELNTEKYTIIGSSFSIYGTTLTLKDKKGNTKRVLMPKGINTTTENNRDEYLRLAKLVQDVLNSGNYPINPSTGKQYTEQELRTLWSQHIQNAHLMQSQLGLQNETKPQTFNPYGY